MKYCTILARIATQIMLYSAIKNKQPQFLELCGIESTSTQETTNYLLRLVLLVCIPYVCRFYRKLGFDSGFIGNALSAGQRLLTLRVAVLLVVKLLIWLISGGQFNFVFAMKNCIWQIILISTCVGIDTFSFYAGQAAEIIFIDPFLMTITIYQTTQSFCNKFTLFHIDLNLLVLCISAIEGFAFYSNKVNTIYTKQDAYRLLMTTAIFSIFYSLASLSTFHYKYAASLLFSFPLMVLAMRKFKQSEFKKSLIYMLSNLILVISIRILIKYSQTKVLPEILQL